MSTRNSNANTGWQQGIRRRTFLTQSAYGLGGMALAWLLNPKWNAMAAGAGGVIQPLHFPAKARRIIHLYMAGGPSHLECLDFKPELKKLHGQPFPESFTRGQQLAQLQNSVLKARGPFVEFHKHGDSGQEISDLFPNIASIADDICIVRSMHTEQINHDPAHAFMNSGTSIKGRPSMGSWLLYGLGAETEDLPGFIVLTSQGKNGQQPVSARQWSSGFLPSKYQGILFQSRGEAVHYVGNPEGVCQSTQRQVVEEINRLNGMLAEERADPEIHTRISQYELAFRMQTSVPELTDFRKEPPRVRFPGCRPPNHPQTHPPPPTRLRRCPSSQRRPGLGQLGKNQTSRKTRHASRPTLRARRHPPSPARLVACRKTR